MDKIIIRGARENNLKNIDLTLPKNKLIVMTGVSGSGKSSLAFDTIYAEGQRRYVESLSAYAAPRVLSAAPGWAGRPGRWRSSAPPGRCRPRRRHAPPFFVRITPPPKFQRHALR